MRYDMIAYERLYRDQIISQTLCSDCGALPGVSCSGRRGVRKSAHGARIWTFMKQPGAPKYVRSSTEVISGGGAERKRREH